MKWMKDGFLQDWTRGRGIRQAYAKEEGIEGTLTGPLEADHYLRNYYQQLASPDESEKSCQRDRRELEKIMSSSPRARQGMQAGGFGGPKHGLRVRE